MQCTSRIPCQLRCILTAALQKENGVYRLYPHMQGITEVMLLRLACFRFYLESRETAEPLLSLLNPSLDSDNEVCCLVPVTSLNCSMTQQW